MAKKLKLRIKIPPPEVRKKKLVRRDIVSQPQSVTPRIKIRLPKPPPKRNLPANAITCGTCEEWWTALGAAHCSGCHRTFSTTNLFDRHRSSVGAHGSCLDPEKVVNTKGDRIMFFRDNMWRGPEMTAEQKQKLYG